MRTILFFFLFLLPIPSSAQYWNWSQTAPYHKAACRVTSKKPFSNIGSGGAGTYITTGKYLGVITARHVMEGPSATVTFSDGTKKTGRWTHDKYNYDLALIFVSHPSIKPLPISRTQPQIGETVDQMGWGGNTKANRHYLAQIVEYEKAYTITNGAITSGDSGGGVINSRGELVGVNSIGKNLITNINGWPVHKEAGYVPQPATLAFTQRINKLANRGQLRPSYPGWG